MPFVRGERQEVNEEIFARLPTMRPTNRNGGTTQR